MTLTRPCPTCETEAPLVIAKHQPEPWKSVHAVMTDCDCGRQPMTGKFSCAEHTYGPDNYFGWHEWATNMQKTHRQVQCDECTLWHIWLPKRLDD